MNAPVTDARPDLPVGPVALVFTDIEGSTRLLQAWGADYPAQLEAHRQIMRAAFAAHGGVEVDTQGDAFFAVFGRVERAIAAAARAQRDLHGYRWPPDSPLRVRIGVHWGKPARTREGYVGLDLHRGARVMGAGRGGQILLSGAAAQRLGAEGAGALDSAWELCDRGEHYLKDLARPEAIFELRIRGLSGEFGPLRTLGARLHNLPLHLTPIVGRKREIEALSARFKAGERLITLLGPGGTGKTRLSLEVALATLQLWDDGVYFVPLAPIAAPIAAHDATLAPDALESALETAVARALALRDDDSHSDAQRVLEHLKTRRVLLVLDNFEHLVGGAAVVARWMAHCDGLAVLSSSRIPLRLNGEHQFPVAPLALPRQGRLPDPEKLAQLSAVALFVERARAVKPNFSVDAANAPIIAEICVRLDGLPLALELAAARIKLLPPQMLLKRLERSLAFLVGGAREVAARHQTLRAAIRWSFDLLDDDAKRLFRRLAVFRGGFGFESAGQVCGADGADVFEGIASLLDQSLLVRRDEIEGEPRFGMLETIREFALEMLQEAGEAEALRERHLQWCLSESDERNAEMHRDFGRAVRLFKAEADNWRAAWNWCIKARPDRALRLAAGSALLWNRSGGTTENYERLQAALDTAPAGARPNADEARLRCRALQYLVQTDRHRANWPQYRARLEQLETLARQADSPEFAAIALDQRMWDTVGAGDNQSALHQGETILELRRLCVERARAAGDESEIARLENELHDAMILHVEITADAGQMDEAWALMEESLALKRAAGDKGGLTFGLYKRAQLLALCGHYAQAHAVSEEVVRRAQHNDDYSLQRAYYLDDAAQHALHNGKLARARELASAGYAIWKEEDAKLGYLMTLTTLAMLHEKAGHWALFARTLGAIDALASAQGTAAPSDGFPQMPTPPENAAIAALGEAEFNAQRRLGTRLGPRQAIELGLSVASIH